MEEIAPLITIGITCFNAEGTIKRAIASALGQDWPNFEVLVVDDASVDASAEVIGMIASRDSRVRVVRHPSNRGPAGARNSIIKHARGEFIAFFDDDDESTSSRLTTQYEAISNHEAISRNTLVACYASGVRRYPNGYELEIAAIGSRPERPDGNEVVDYLLFNRRGRNVFYGGGTPTCALMLRRNVLETVGGFDESLRRVEDVDLAIRLAQAGAAFVGSSAPLYLQYATTGSDKTPLMNLQSELLLTEKHAAYLRQRSRYEYARRWFHIRYLHFSGQRLRFSIALTLLLLRHPLWGLNHLLTSAPARWRHERKMRAGHL